MQAIKDVRMILHRGDVGKLGKAMSIFNEKFELVQQYIEQIELGHISSEDVARLQQLGMMHHKVMRSMMIKMHHIEEDVRMIEDASARLHFAASQIN